MSLRHRLIGGLFAGLVEVADAFATLWQTPREVEWAKAAADGLAEREAEVDVAEPHFGRCTCPCINCSNQAHWMCHGEGVEIDTQQRPDECHHDSLSGDEGPVALLGRMPERWRCDECDAIFETRPVANASAADDAEPGCPRCSRLKCYCHIPADPLLPGEIHGIRSLLQETSATTPVAVDGPAEGEPPEPSAGVDWLGRSDRDSLWRLSGALDPVEAVKYGWHDDCWSWTDDGGETWRPSHAQRGVILPAPSGEQWIKVPSAEVEPPASAPSAESPAPEFDWVTAAIPVIAGVLAEHQPTSVGRPERAVFCGTTDEFCGEFADWDDWRNHVAPRIAVALQTDLLSTIYEDTTFAINAFSGDRPRPLADLPKHQNPRM